MSCLKEILFGAPLEEAASQRLLVSREVTLAGQACRVPVSLESPHPSLRFLSKELDSLPAAPRASQQALSCVEKGENNPGAAVRLKNKIQGSRP